MLLVICARIHSIRRAGCTQIPMELQNTARPFIGLAQGFPEPEEFAIPNVRLYCQRSESNPCPLWEERVHAQHDSVEEGLPLAGRHCRLGISNCGKKIKCFILQFTFFSLHTFSTLRRPQLRFQSVRWTAQCHPWIRAYPPWMASNLPQMFHWIFIANGKGNSAHQSVFNQFY